MNKQNAVCLHDGIFGNKQERRRVHHPTQVNTEHMMPGERQHSTRPHLRESSRICQPMEAQSRLVVAWG